MVERLLSGGADRPLLHDMISGTSSLVWRSQAVGGAHCLVPVSVPGCNVHEVSGDLEVGC